MSPLTDIEGTFYNDPPIPEAKHKEIRILEQSEVKELWDRYISAANRHFMLLGSEEWPAVITGSSEPIDLWLEDWNENLFSRIMNRLREYRISQAEPALIFWMRERGIETNWQIFCSHWINFLYEDEGCIVLFPNDLNAFIFSNGRVWNGRRELLPAQQGGASQH